MTPLVVVQVNKSCQSTATTFLYCLENYFDAAEEPVVEFSRVYVYLRLVVGAVYKKTRLVDTSTIYQEEADNAEFDNVVSLGLEVMQLYEFVDTHE